MAATLLRQTNTKISNGNILFEFSKIFYSSKKRRLAALLHPVKEKSLESFGTSLASKGFLRSTKPYNPPENIEEKIKSICSSMKVSSLVNMENKFKVLKACFDEFKHGVPNSQIYEINELDDLIEFYATPVDTTIPLDAMKNMDLPENLHVQYEPLRFHPATDTKFNGQTAFPKSSTLVTGLKYRNKYQGHVAKRSWP